MVGKKINWLNHFIEFIVVVLGILIAFQLNTCREAQNEQALVDEHMQNIIAETELNRKMLQGNIKVSAGLLNKADSVISYIENDRDLDTINSLSLGMIALDYTYLKKNAYNSLVESGDIRFINDFELKNDIVSVYEYYKWLEGIDISTRTTYLEQLFPYVVEHLDLINFQPQNADIYHSKKFKNYVSVYRFSIEYRLRKQEDVLEVLNKFLEENKTQN